MARASHLAFAIQGGLQGEFGDLDIKYLKQNISKSRSKISGSFRRNFVALCKNGDLVVSIIRVCFLIVGGNGSDESRVSDEPSCQGNLNCRLRMLSGQNSSLGGMSYVARRKGDRLCVQGVRTPPLDDTERVSLSRATPSGFPKRTRGALPYPDSLREKHTALVNIMPWTIAYPIRICCPDH
uniref:Uncharacterized protein n=1 Tax=Vitis vinifera TaxID=29760 RepID=A5BZB7_VITVI|nr:hypothetical protein VITISV_009647 [Vitis vinifera]